MCSPFLFKNMFLWGSNRTSSLDYNAHTGGWLIIRKIYIQKQFEKKKSIFVYFVVTKKTRFKAYRYIDKFPTNKISHACTGCCVHEFPYINLL